MDLWNATKEQIKAAAERKSGKRVSRVQPLGSGLWVYVEMVDGSEVTVYDHEVRRGQ